MISQNEQRVNIKFCVYLRKQSMETIKLLREAYGSECMAASTIYEWYYSFSENRNKAPLHEKKSGQPRMSIMETNINTIMIDICLQEL